MEDEQGMTMEKGEESLDNVIKDFPGCFINDSTDSMENDSSGDEGEYNLDKEKDTYDRETLGERVDARGLFKSIRASLSGKSKVISMPTEKEASHYIMEHKNRGKAFIFNHKIFDSRLQLNPQKWTNCGKDKLETCLRKLDFDVKIYDDLSFKDIERTLEKASMEDYIKCDCILVTVLTYENKGNLFVRDRPYKPERLLTHFTADKCKKLAGKPKLFFIDACEDESRLTRTCTDAAPTTFHIPNHADFLIVHSTIPSIYSGKTIRKCSLFIHVLVHILQKEGHTKDLLSIMTRVNRKVAHDFEVNVLGDYVMHLKKKVPCITSMLTRDIIFTRKLNCAHY